MVKDLDIQWEYYNWEHPTDQLKQTILQCSEMLKKWLSTKLYYSVQEFLDDKDKQ